MNRTHTKCKQAYVLFISQRHVDSSTRHKTYVIHKPPHLVGVWFDEDQRPNTVKTHVQTRSDYVFEFQYYSTLTTRKEWGKLLHSTKESPHM